MNYDKFGVKEEPNSPFVYSACHHDMIVFAAKEQTLFSLPPLPRGALERKHFEMQS